MLKKIKTYSVPISSLLLVLTLSACGSVSRINDQGATAQPVWPDAKDVTFNTGSYPKVQDLRAVAPGMAKDQLYNLLGRPHFNEGLFGVREWDYLFHFRTASTDLTCQYKVIFDKNKIARNFYWQPESCADVLKG